MKLTSKNEVVIQAFSTYSDPQWSDFRGANTKDEALTYVERAPDLMLRVVERTVVTIEGDWVEVTG